MVRSSPNQTNKPLLVWGRGRQSEARSKPASSALPSDVARSRLCFQPKSSLFSVFSSRGTFCLWQKGHCLFSAMQTPIMRGIRDGKRQGNDVDDCLAASNTHLSHISAHISLAAAPLWWRGIDTTVCVHNSTKIKSGRRLRERATRAEGSEKRRGTRRRTVSHRQR